MSNLPRRTHKDLIDEVARLTCRVNELELIEQQYQKALVDVSRKEAFNFALFQFNPALTVIVDREGRVVKSNFARRRNATRLPNIGDIMYKEYAARHHIDMYANLLDAIATDTTRSYPELPYDDKVLSITIAPFPEGAIIISEDITTQKNAENDRTKLITDLQRALDELETLRGLLPICASCKKIRDDSGYWNHIEAYISQHAHVDFTHTLCPECIRHFYPEYWQRLQDRKNESPAACLAKP